MDFISNSNNPSSFYPTSPDNHLLFYSAPTSPMAYESDDINYKTDDDDDFEFETSQRFSHGWSSPTFDSCPAPIIDEQAMSFADQLFFNGHVLPLKLPPRLLATNSNSIPTSPKSPIRIPFTHRSTWNDNFDPFMVALDKVTHDTRGRKSVHRRTRSLSPFRTTPIIDSNGSFRWNQDQHKHHHHQQADSTNTNTEMVKAAKGSAYARWVRIQTMGHKRSSSGASSKSLTKSRTSIFGSKRVTSENSQVGISAESKMQKMKSILVKFTSFRKENNPSIAAAAPMRKPGNFFKKLSFKFKGGNEKKKVVCSPSAGGESKIMALVKYNPKLPLCLGYVPASPNRLQT